MFSNFQGKYVELDNNVAYPSRKEMQNLSIMSPGMNVLLWNVRGIARDGFKRNIRQLIKDHDPDIIILTETKVSKIGFVNKEPRAIHTVVQEEIFWATRARSDWLLQGDINTSFFHSLAIIRGKRNKILDIKNSVGEWLHDPQLIHSHILQHFKQLFTSEITPSLILSYSFEDIDCATIPSMLEIKESLFSIGPNKSPGTDGFHAALFQVACECIH
uniref:Endonuclease/exonuclease/phosphatase domain-containing protein n=1 Tax=Chenopodium quinoa TaxID=63459 RepID=A0A803M743_CHEQI